MTEHFTTDASTPSPELLAAEARFFTAAAGKPPTDEQRAVVAQLRAAIVQVGYLIEAHVPVGRNKALALTALEDVQMRANRGIFAPPANR
jgi:hypothetical protein